MDLLKKKLLDFVPSQVTPIIILIILTTKIKKNDIVQQILSLFFFSQSRRFADRHEDLTIIFFCTLLQKKYLKRYILANIILVLLFLQLETHATYYQLQNAYKNSTVNNSVGIINITFAKDLNIDLYISIFYHLKHARLQSLSVPVELRQTHRFLVLLLISGAVSVNLGPLKYPCGNKICHTTVAKNHRAILCESCFYLVAH